MRKDTIKARLYQIPLEHKKPMKHKELVEAHILEYPSYAKNYTQTKMLIRKKDKWNNTFDFKAKYTHPRNSNRNCSPYVYYFK